MRWLVLVGFGVFAGCDSGTPFSDIGLNVEMTYQDGELAIRASAQDVHAPPGQTEINDPKLRIAVRLRGEEIGLA